MCVIENGGSFPHPLYHGASVKVNVHFFAAVWGYTRSIGWALLSYKSYVIGFFSPFLID